MTWGLNNRSGIFGKSGEKRVSVVKSKKTVPRCFLELASKMKPYTPWTEQGGDEFLNYVVDTEILEERWGWIKSAENGKSGWRKFQMTFA